MMRIMMMMKIMMLINDNDDDNDSDDDTMEKPDITLNFLSIHLLSIREH